MTIINNPVILSHFSVLDPLLSFTIRCWPTLLLNDMSDQTTMKREVAGAPVAESEESLRDTLKRCSAETLEAALAYRKNGDVSLVPVIVLGIVERFLDPDVGDKLHSGGDSIEFMTDLGMDSLTMIEAIMMVEESLGVSIKNEELLNLRSVGDLKSFIHEKLTGIACEEPKTFYSVDQIAAIMPQQSPFLFLSQATVTELGANGSYLITGQEEFLEGHFKGNPVFPASLMLEALGQLAVFKLIKNPPREVQSTIDSSEIYFTGVDSVRCHRICKPGDTLEMKIQVKRVREPLAIFSGQITVNGEKSVVAEEITLAFKSEGAASLLEGSTNGLNGGTHSTNGAH